MDSFLISVYNSNFSFLLSNIFGLYLPFLISFIFIIKFSKEIFNKNNLVIFLLGVIVTFMTSNPIIGEDFSQLHLTNYVGIFYLLFFVFIEKNKEMSIPSVFTLSFLAMWIIDGYYAITLFNSHPFSSAIGGAGVFDGLLIDPLLTSLGVYIINEVRERKNNKLKSA